MDVKKINFIRLGKGSPNTVKFIFQTFIDHFNQNFLSGKGATQ